MDNSLGKDSIPVEHIAALHDLGYLPLLIKALPEGTIVGPKKRCHDTQHKARIFLASPITLNRWCRPYSGSLAPAPPQLCNTAGGLPHLPKKPWAKPMDGFCVLAGTRFLVSGAWAVLKMPDQRGRTPVVVLWHRHRTGYWFSWALLQCQLRHRNGGRSVPATEHSVMHGHQEDEIEPLKDLLPNFTPKVLCPLFPTPDFLESDYYRIFAWAAK